MAQLFPWAGAVETVMQALAEGRIVSQADAMRAFHWLVTSGAQDFWRKYKVESLYPTPRHGGEWVEGQPTGWVDHYTAAGSARGTLVWFSKKERPPGVGNSSSHFLISPEGEAMTVVNPLAHVAWHAGRANPWSIGVEHVNCGLLKTNAKLNRFFYLDKIQYRINWARPPAKVGDGFWEPFTTPQIVTNIVLKRLARRVFPHLVKTSFTQHSVVSPGRKIDCGPMWPIEEINDLAFCDVPLVGFGWVTRPYMNLEELKLLRAEVSKALKTVYPHVEKEAPDER